PDRPERPSAGRRPDADQKQADEDDLARQSPEPAGRLPQPPDRGDDQAGPQPHPHGPERTPAARGPDDHDEQIDQQDGPREAAGRPPKRRTRGHGRIVDHAASAARLSLGSRASARGSHQLRSPSSVIVAGRSSARITVASMSTATASPKPICLSESKPSVAKIPNTPTITIAALVTVEAVERMPRSTASRVEWPRSTSSRIRLTMNTW